MNGARNIIRAHRRHPTGDLDELDPIPTEVDKPEDAAVIEEELARLQWALGQLPYAQKEVLSLRVYGHMPFKEIARRQGVSTNTALGRYRYAIDRLRSLLNGEVRR